MSTQAQSNPGATRVPEARYSYYRRCQVFRKGGEQCKAPAEKGAQICHAHYGQLATAVRRERERRAVLAEAVTEMRRRGKPECKMADLFTNFKGIQVTLAVMAQALIDGRIDCKTAGRLAVHLQTMSKLLWMVQGKKRRTLPLINTDDTDLKELKARNNLAANHGEEARKTLPQIGADERRLGKKEKPPGLWMVQTASIPFMERAIHDEDPAIGFGAKVLTFPESRHGPWQRATAA